MTKDLDIYVLDPRDNSRAFMVENYESFVWTEKWQTYGDFELEILEDSHYLSLFDIGTHISHSMSKRIQVVENVVSIEDESGKRIHRVSGYSKEKVLENRIYVPRFTLKKNKDGQDEWHQNSINHTPQGVINFLWDELIIKGRYGNQDKIPYLTEHVPYPPGIIPFPTRKIQYLPDATNLLNIFKDVCEAWDLGFRITFNSFFDNRLAFDVYSGNDLTSDNNNQKPAVIFSTALENLNQTRESSSIEKYKNVACIAGGPHGYYLVYGEGVPTSVSGFDRRVLVIDESRARIEEGETFPTDAMLDKAISELAKSRSTYIMDGQVPKYPQFEYGKDYELGDIVEMRNIRGVRSKMRVAEQTFSCDGEGVMSYPGLLHMTSEVPGTWSSPEWNIEWPAALKTWGELP